MFTCINGGVTTIKPGHQTAGNMHAIWSDESSLRLLPTSEKVYIWRTPKSGMSGSNSEIQGSVMVWADTSW
jgi:hypothetical protein